MDYEIINEELRIASYRIADLNKEYETFLEEDMEQANDEIKASYKEMCTAFENYLSAIEESMWKQGFMYAMKRETDRARRKAGVAR